jgi:putative acetyltransferase
MIVARRMNSEDADFQALVEDLDLDLKIRDGDEHVFYAELNKTGTMKHVVVAYDGEKAVGCGAFREYAPGVMEIKRMFVPSDQRRKGIASKILKELETWCHELGMRKCILETGRNQPEAIRLYAKNGYERIPNFGKYRESPNSVCFEKSLRC